LGKLLEVLLPLLWNGARIDKKGLVKVFDVSGITARYVGAAPKVLHRVIVHFARPGNQKFKTEKRAKSITAKVRRGEMETGKICGGADVHAP
jgi:hypothetical protein